MAASAFDLPDLPLLKGMAAADRGRLLESAVLHSVTAGAILFEQGEAPNFQYVVLSG